MVTLLSVFLLFPLRILGVISEIEVNGRLAEFRQAYSIQLTGRSNLTIEQQKHLDRYERQNKIARVPFEGWRLGQGVVFYIDTLRYYEHWDLLDVFVEMRVGSLSHEIPRHCPDRSLLFLQSEYNEVLCRVPYSMNETGEVELACRVENPKRYIIRGKSVVMASIRIPCDYMNTFVVLEANLIARLRKRGLPCDSECRLVPVYAYTPEFLLPKNVDIKTCALVDSTKGSTRSSNEDSCYDTERKGLAVMARVDEELEEMTIPSLVAHRCKCQRFYL